MLASERYAGDIAEVDTFGQVDQGEREKAVDLGKENPEGVTPSESLYLPYKSALRLVRSLQRDGNTQNPDAPFAKDLYDNLLTKIKLVKENKGVLRYYTALSHTIADIKHGIDAWLEIETSYSSEPIIVTLDASLRYKTPEELKADVLILVPNSGYEDLRNFKPANYDKSVDLFSDSIAEAFERKINK